MTLLSPSWLLLLLLIPAVIALHLFRRHRRSEIVPSLLIWKLLSKRTPRTFDLRVLRDLNLLLQILAVIAAALLLANPVLPSTGTSLARDLVLVVDVSASMGVSDEGSSRIEAARSAAFQVADGAAPGARIAVVAAGATPTLVQSFTDSPDAVDGALRGLAAQPVAGDFGSAVSMATSLAGDDGEVHLFTDGAFDWQTKAARASVVVHRVGTELPNVGITRFAARRARDGWELLVTISNASDGPVTAGLEILAGQATLRNDAVSLAPGELRYEVVTARSEGEAELVARLVGVSDGANALPADDVARTVVDESAAARVLLVSEETYFLETVLSVIPQVEVTRSETFPVPGRHDAVVFDGITPPPLLAGNYLLFGVRPPDLPTAFGEPVSVSAPVSWQPDHPLFQAVSLDRVEVERVRPIDSTDGIDVIARIGTRPIGYTYERAGLRIAGFTFSLADTDLPLRVAFPLLVRNAVSWMLPEGNIGEVRQVATGEPYSVSIPIGDAVIVRYPSGRTERRVAERNPFVIRDTSEAGIYEVRSASVQRRFAAALTSEQETDLRPRLVAPTATPETEDLPAGAGRQLWRIVLAFLIVCVAADWYVWVRRS